MNKSKLVKRTIWSIVIVFISMNIVAYIHAYKFTHFVDSSITKTKNPESLTTFDKFKTILFGINNPRPKNKKRPIQKFETIILQSNKKIECWKINADSAKGTIIIFHGFSGEKSSMLDKSNEFIKLGYNTVLVDFMGSGGSEGNQCTIGVKEAEEVKSVFEYLKSSGEKNIYLFGTSMGAVAILKSINDFNISPKAIIIECPFGSMYKTTCARFKNMNAPVFPMAGLLIFWGGIQNGFWAFTHNPTEYAKQVNCPTLLLYGEKDITVSKDETDEIYQNLKGEKTLKKYPLAGHENFLVKYKAEWIIDVKHFLEN